jgi:hypothetical protein
LLDQLSPVGQHQHPPALAGSAAGDRADRLALAGAGGHHGTHPSVGLEGGAEIGEQVLLVVAQDDLGHGGNDRLGTETRRSARFRLSSLALCP